MSRIQLKSDLSTEIRNDRILWTCASCGAKKRGKELPASYSLCPNCNLSCRCSNCTAYHGRNEKFQCSSYLGNCAYFADLWTRFQSYELKFASKYGSAPSNSELSILERTLVDMSFHGSPHSYKLVCSFALKLLYNYGMEYKKNKLFLQMVHWLIALGHFDLSFQFIRNYLLLDKAIENTQFTNTDVSGKVIFTRGHPNQSEMYYFLALLYLRCRHLHLCESYHNFRHTFLLACHQRLGAHSMVLRIVGCVEIFREILSFLVGDDWKPKNRSRVKASENVEQIFDTIYIYSRKLCARLLNIYDYEREDDEAVPETVIVGLLRVAEKSWSADSTEERKILLRCYRDREKKEKANRKNDRYYR